MNNRTQIIDLFTDRFLEIIKTKKPFHSPHEVYGKLLEEVHEVQKEVFQKSYKHSPTLLIDELIDVALVALRGAIDVWDKYHA